MWYSLRSMRAMFYAGAMLALIGLGIIFWDYRLAGAIILCIGIALSMIGFLGIAVNMAVSHNIAMKNRRRA